VPSAGLIVAEGTWPSATGQAYCRQPGIATPAQVAGWRARHRRGARAGGRIVLQLMHAGRIGSRHGSRPPGVETVAPSAIRAAGEVFTDAAGLQPYDEPRALATDEVPRRGARARRRPRQCARRRLRRRRTARHQRLPADAVPQFVGTNQRSDAYGGSAAASARVSPSSAWQRWRGHRRRPGGAAAQPGQHLQRHQDEDSAATHAELMRQAATLGLAYLHVMRAPVPDIDAFALAREHFGGR
jgi:N-ethylmaleimide reductase